MRLKFPLKVLDLNHKKYVGDVFDVDWVQYDTNVSNGQETLIRTTVQLTTTRSFHLYYENSQPTLMGVPNTLVAMVPNIIYLTLK